MCVRVFYILGRFGRFRFQYVGALDLRLVVTLDKTKTSQTISNILRRSVRLCAFESSDLLLLQM